MCAAHSTGANQAQAELVSGWMRLFGLPLLHSCPFIPALRATALPIAISPADGELAVRARRVAVMPPPSGY
jgi:hypothetical protein